ncbi:ATP-binding cassette sub-family A member 3 [Nymphon striatum]|nr:ATP-binding cassette sub-family A member 3 [Nymphon striatum]
MRYIGLVAFDSLSNGKFNKDIEFKVRLNPTPFNYDRSVPGSSQRIALKKWNTNKQYPLFQLPQPRSKSSIWGGPPGYMAEGFLPIQHAVSMAIISHLSGKNDIPVVEMQRYPFPPYIHDPFLFALQSFFPLSHYSESMKVMGLSNWLHWLAWFVKSFILIFISTVILVILIHQVLHKASAFVLLLFFTTIIINIISFSFLLSVFFSKASSISTAAGVLFFCAYLPYAFVSSRYETLSLSEKLLLSLFGNTAMSFGSQLIVMWEGSGSGVQFNNLNLPASPDDTLTLLHILIMLLPSYWCGKSASSVTDAEDVDELAKASQYIEDNPIGLKAGISIQSLTKVYPPNNTAVNDLSLKMYKDQITALLGHNGAGKTTTMAMLTGIYPPTRGTAFVNDFDIRTNMADIRKNLGFCPQHDILFDDLTVEEHLKFFCTLKGYTGHDVKMEIDNILDMLNLEDKRKALSKTLSGGMKRKLSVGIALCADSKASIFFKTSIIVMLDEPTSGMDPSARRSTWDLLNQQKKNRTILLTTHYMEEADVLGDRIAILANGELQCCGSSMFLKKKYGAGYHMVLVKESTCNVDTIADLVTQFVPNAEMESDMGAELSYILPHESSSNFQALFQQIEDNKEALGISGYGASITTMEEVFIKVGEKMDTGESTAFTPSFKPNTGSSRTSSVADNDSCRNKGIRLIGQQVYALLVKRILYSWRNKLLTLSQLAIPVMLMIFALLIIQTTPKVVDSSSLTLELSVFQNTEVPATDFNGNNTNSSNLFQIYKSQFPSSSDNEFVDVSAKTDANFNKYLSDVGAKDISRFSLHWVIGATFSENKTDNVQVTAFFNNQPYHAAPISLSMAQSAILKSYVSSDYQFTALQEASLGRDGYQVAQNLMFGVAFLSASFIVFLIKERAVRAKHLQVVSGVNLLTFWVTTFIWDFINYFIPCVIILMMFFVFNNEEYTVAVVQGMFPASSFGHAWHWYPSQSFTVCPSYLPVPATGYSRASLLMVIIGLGSDKHKNRSIPEYFIFGAASSVLQANDIIQMVIDEVEGTNQLVESCRIYLSRELFITELECLAYFNHFVTFPFLNCVQISSQGQLLPKLHNDLIKGNIDTLQNYIVSIHGMRTPTLSNNLSTKIIEMMCATAASAVKLQCGKEYGFSEVKLRAPDLSLLSEKDLEGLPTNNLVAERDFSRFDREARVTKSRNRRFKAKNIQNNMVLYKCSKEIKIDKLSRTLAAILSCREAQWDVLQHEKLKTRLEAKLNKSKKSEDYTKKLLQNYKSWRGPCTSLEELQQILKEKSDQNNCDASYEWYIGYVKSIINNGYIVDHLHRVVPGCHIKWKYPSTEDVQTAELEQIGNCTVKGEWDITPDTRKSFFIIENIKAIKAAFHSLASLISVTILEIPVIGEVELSKTLDWVFSLLPMYCLGRGTFKINQNHGYIQLCDQIFSYAAESFHITDREKLCAAAAVFNRTIPCCPQTCNGPDSVCLKYSDNYLAWESPGIGRYLIFLLIDFFLFVLILIGIEKHYYRRIKYFFCVKKSVKPSEDRTVLIPSDDDVEREKERIVKSPLSDLCQSDMLIFRDLTKTYGSLVAVDHLSLGITKGECFGLLGMNGAGKTSTFKMITGDENVSEGDAYLNGFSIKNDISEVQQRLGYCPQFDALIDEFTGSETLCLFARLRGVPESTIGHVIKKLSEDLIFEKHLHKLTKNYSGGNKRKLSTAIALIGDSPIIFLDEPTAGVDPVARRLMWKTICDVKNSGRSVLLTSHSMEECEALCGRLVIMVNGECCCLGSPQHLKSKFSEGYTVLVKLEEDDTSSQKNTSFTSVRSSSAVYMRSLSRTGDVSKSQVDKFQNFFMEMFPRAELKSLHQLFIHYHIPLDPSVGWAKIFGAMEKAKEKYHIEDYTVSQTSLEQVFLQFAALQRTPKE